MPRDAPAAKLAATRGYQEGQPGSEVVLYDRYTEDREAIGRRLAEARGMTLIPPYDHPHVMAGQGTAALELVDDGAQVLGVIRTRIDQDHLGRSRRGEDPGIGAVERHRPGIGCQHDMRMIVDAPRRPVRAGA